MNAIVTRILIIESNEPVAGLEDYLATKFPEAKINRLAGNESLEVQVFSVNSAGSSLPGLGELETTVNEWALSLNEKPKYVYVGNADLFSRKENGYWEPV